MSGWLSRVFTSLSPIAKSPPPDMSARAPPPHRKRLRPTDPSHQRGSPARRGTARNGSGGDSGDGGTSDSDGDALGTRSTGRGSCGPKAKRTRRTNPFEAHAPGSGRARAGSPHRATAAAENGAASSSNGGGNSSTGHGGGGSGNGLRRLTTPSSPVPTRSSGSGHGTAAAAPAAAAASTARSSGRMQGGPSADWEMEAHGDRARWVSCAGEMHAVCTEAARRKAERTFGLGAHFEEPLSQQCVTAPPLPSPPPLQARPL